VCGAIMKKDAKSKVAAKKWLDGRLMAKKIDNDNSGEFVLPSQSLAPNSPELSLLNFLPLAYHQAISWSPPWVSHLFFTMAFLRVAQFFYTWAVLD